jgi:hypothetical protein
VREAGWHSTEREREAARLERDGDDVCAAFLLERELFERGWKASFEGEVSGVVGAGAFIRFEGELADVYEGFLPAREWGGREYYALDESETALVGRKSGKRLRMGDPVTVTVSSVEAPRGRVDLLPAEASADSRPGAKGSPRTGGAGKGAARGKGAAAKGKGKSSGKSGGKSSGQRSGKGGRPSGKGGGSRSGKGGGGSSGKASGGGRKRPRGKR